jgi:hypothetical protein
MRRLGRVLLGLTLVATTGCESAGLSPSASVTTTLPGVTESRFKVDWAAASNARGQTIEGHIENVSGWTAVNVRLLVQALDPSGQIVDQRLEWLGGPVPAGSRSYFRVGGLPAADHYRVTIWSHSAIRGD